MYIKDTSFDDDVWLKIVKSNFYPDMVIKNYNELCNFFGLDSGIRGNTKKAILKNLNRFCDYRKEGHKFIITDIFEVPKEKEDKRLSGNNSVYVDLIKPILLDYFIRLDQDTLNFTKNQLWKNLGMINKNFINPTDDSTVYKYQQVIPNIQKWHLNNAFINSRKKLSDITRTFLNSLTKLDLISYEEVIVAHKNGRYFEVKRPWHITEIQECESKALTMLGCRSLSDVFYSSSKDISYAKYTEIRNKELKENPILGYDFIFNRYSISRTSKFKEDIISLKEPVDKLKEELRIKIANSLVDGAERAYFKNKHEFMDGITDFSYPTNYVEIQRTIIYRLFGIDSSSYPIEESDLDNTFENESIDEAFSRLCG